MPPENVYGLELLACAAAGHCPKAEEKAFPSGMKKPNWEYMARRGLITEIPFFYPEMYDRSWFPKKKYRPTDAGKKVIMEENYWHLERCPEIDPSMGNYEIIEKIRGLEGNELANTWHYFVKEFGNSAKCQEYCK